MDYVKIMLRRFFAAVLSVILAFIPFSDGRGEKTEDEVKLKVAIVSDVHIDRRFPVGQLALINCYQDMLKFNPDAVAVLGDLTNYGDYATLEKFFEITKQQVPDEVAKVIIAGNHDIGHAKDADGGRLNPEALRDFEALCNQYFDYGIETGYYTREVNGYHFICMNDESADNWDHPEYSDAALNFLDSELNAYADQGKPVFVLLHVPLAGIHGEENFYYSGCTEEPWNTQIKTILQKHENIFCLTGHLHKGLSNNPDTPTYERDHGVHYLNLPSYLMPNWPVDLAINGLGFIMEVTDNNVTFRCRNYYMHNWYSLFDYSIDLVK